MSDYRLHDPDAGPLDYSIDFTSWLNPTDSVATAVWSVFPVEVGGVAMVTASDTLASNIATAKFSGGVLGHIYRVTCRPTSTKGLVDDRSFVLRIGQK